MRLTKKEFVEIMKLFENVYGENWEICDNLCIDMNWRPTRWIDSLWEYFTDMIALESNKALSDDYMGEFLFGLSFGKEWEPGMDEALKTAENLYDFLNT